MSDVGEERDTVGCQPSNHSLIRPEQAGASAENTNLLVNNNPSQCSTAAGPGRAQSQWELLNPRNNVNQTPGSCEYCSSMIVWRHGVTQAFTLNAGHNQALGALWEQSVQDIYSRTSKSCLDNKSWQFNSFRLKREAKTNFKYLKPLTYSCTRLKRSKVLRSIWLRNII